MASVAHSPPSTVLRAVAAALRRLADRVEHRAMGSLPLEPLVRDRCADELIRERRHQVFTRYY